MPDAFPETSRVAVLLVSHDGARWLPAVIEGIRAQTAPLTPGGGRRHRQQGRERRPAGAGLRRRAAGLGRDRLPGRRRDRPRTAPDHGPRLRVGLAAARRLQPRARRAGRAARRRRRAPGGRHPRPQAARVALAAPAAGARRHDLRHRAPGDRPRARRVRPGPARRGAHRARGQHRRDAGPSAGARGAGRLRRPAPDLRQRHRLRLARGGRGSHHDGGARGGRVPRGGGPPRDPPDAADRTAHPLPGAPGGALHAVGQLPPVGAAPAGDPAGVRHRAADDRVPAGPVRR